MTDQSQQLLSQAALYQQQMQGIAAQKEALNMQLMEISSALDELEKTASKEVYKIAGPLILKSDREEVQKDMAEKKELIHTRLQVLEKSEHKIKTKVDELRERLTKAG
ncbi:MAG: prefoldin subunit beta [Candidatus Aenigmarchaeota archaeon]|nr:prefoldin subunit beta [Candidatus Aenigmarchaeota archaeon]